MNWDKYPNFSEREFACRCGCGQALMAPEFMDRLQALRTEYAKPMVIRSGYRCPEYNARESTTGLDGPHTTGRAVDVLVSGADGYMLTKLAMRHNFTGLGANQRGKHSGRFLHLDDLTEPSAPRPRIWTYG